MQLTEEQRALLLRFGTEDDVRYAENDVVEYDFEALAADAAAEDAGK